MLVHSKSRGDTREQLPTSRKQEQASRLSWTTLLPVYFQSPKGLRGSCGTPRIPLSECVVIPICTAGRMPHAGPPEPSTLNNKLLVVHCLPPSGPSRTAPCTGEAAASNMTQKRFSALPGPGQPERLALPDMYYSCPPRQARHAGEQTRAGARALGEEQDGQAARHGMGRGWIRLGPGQVRAAAGPAQQQPAQDRRAPPRNGAIRSLNREGWKRFGL